MEIINAPITQVFVGLSNVFILGLILLYIAFLPLNNRFSFLRSKRDPFFWDSATDKGSPVWLAKLIILRFVFAIMVANLVTPIINEFYADFFGIGRGKIGEQFDLLKQMLINEFSSPLQFLGTISPFNWFNQIQIQTLIWVGTFVLISITLLINVFYRWNSTKFKPTIEFGGAEFTEPSDAVKQYTAVPDRGLEFKGYGGVPLMHKFNLNREGLALYTATVRPKSVPVEFYSYKARPAPKDNKWNIPGHYYIDGKAVNTVVIGETRAGKGETVVLSTIDLIARGNSDQSLIVSDLKGELSTKTIDLLRRHNYNVKVLNFDNLNYSMSMNLLSQALYYAKRKNWAQTKQKVSQLSNTIFSTENANATDKFFANGSASTFEGLALGTIWLLKREEAWDKMTIANVVRMLQELGTESEIVTTDQKRATPGQSLNPAIQTYKMNKLDLLISVMSKKAKELQQEGITDPLLDMAIASFNQSSMGSDDTKGNIYASMFSDVRLFADDISVQKMTTIDDFRYSSVGFPRIMELQLPEYFANRKVNIKFSVKTEAGPKNYDERVIADEMGLVQFAIEPKLNDYTNFEINFDTVDNAIVDQRYADLPIIDRKISITAKKVYEHQGLRGRKIDPYTGLDVINGYKVIEMDTNIEVDKDKIEISFDYSEQRTAIFVVLPPLKKQYYQLALFFMEQLYQENYDWANRNKNKNVNRIHFLLDEFGNFPKWPDMGTKLSAALGYNFAFTLVLQNMEQLDETYGKDAANTLIGNSSNYFYIKTSSLPTAKQISEKLGNRTIRLSTPGQDNEKGDQNVSSKERALLTSEELMKLRPGQMIAFRSAMNYDTRGALVSTHPLYNYGWTAMPFAYNLLPGYISDSTELSRIEVDSPHRFLDLNDYIVDFGGLMDKLYNEVYLVEQEDENERYEQLLDPSELQWLDEDQEEEIRDYLTEMFRNSIDTLSIEDDNEENALKIDSLEMFANSMEGIEMHVLTGESFSKAKLLENVPEAIYERMVQKVSELIEE